MAKQGFTLVELSIVLVIIGLLVGGILVGQDMIAASELRAMFNDASRYRAAVVTFKTKYEAMPGDMRNATEFWGTESSCPGTVGSTELAGTCNGNNNRRIEMPNFTQNSEGFRAWEHLGLAEMVPTRFTGRAASASITDSALPDVNAPSHKRNGVWALLYRDAHADWFGKNGHVLIAFGQNFNVPALRAPEMLQLDTKFDDGKPGTGGITAYTSTINANCVDGTNTITANYVVTQGNPSCHAHFWFQ